MDASPSGNGRGPVRSEVKSSIGVADDVVGCWFVDGFNRPWGEVCEGPRDVLEKLSQGPILGACGVEVGPCGFVGEAVLRHGVGAVRAVLWPDASCGPNSLPYVVAPLRGEAVQGEVVRQVGERDASVSQRLAPGVR